MTAPAQRHTSTPVPREFVGMARVFISRVEAEHDAAMLAMHRIVAPLCARAVAGKRKQRPERLIQAAADYRRIPQFGRLMLAIEQKDRHSLTIHEMRMRHTCYTNLDAWAGASSLGVDIIVATLKIEPGFAPDAGELCLTTVGHHALGRWFERALINSETALRAELAQLAWASSDLMKRFIDGRVNDLEFTVESGGRFVGAVGEDKKDGYRLFIASYKPPRLNVPSVNSIHGDFALQQEGAAP